ncbi:ATP-binding protein [Streptomyces iranensis]|uniref:ATP-binding protein n=1 Tax=Streptomyces iranensis TaxID=576784 RepID=UPI0039B74BED
MPEVKQKYFEPRPESVRLAREFTAAALASWDLGKLAEDVCLCVSELASNALVYGTTPERGFLVRLALDDFVRLEVHDSRNSSRGDHQPHVRHPSPTGTSGRGLLIVQMLADGWGVENREPCGKTVWSRFKAFGPSGSRMLTRGPAVTAEPRPRLTAAPTPSEPPQLPAIPAQSDG